MDRTNDLRPRLERLSSPSLQNWQAPAGPAADQMKSNAWVEMGWGRIIFGHTFRSAGALYDTICQEAENKRDITFYIPNPHVLLSKGPDKVFLDPSHSYRLWLHNYRQAGERCPSLSIRRISTTGDVLAVNRICNARGMVTFDPEFILDNSTSRLQTHFVAEDISTRRIVGTVTGVDHVEAFNDPESGASLWCLAVDPQATAPGVGEALVRHLIEHYLTKGRNYIDLSVMHDNLEAIALYEKLGFQRVPVFCIKRKNKINEALYTGPASEDSLNPYARIITNEARRRGIEVEVIDTEFSLFNLALGGRSIACRESLTELTSAVAMTRCDDKRLTQRLLHRAGLNIPRQFKARESGQNEEILGHVARVVVKPARGEQGNGISVDIDNPEELENAIRLAREHCPDVIVEEYMDGEDLRIIVIDFRVVAAAVRRPPRITGTGRHRIVELVEKYNRRRKAATGGESHVPMDAETDRCLAMAGFDMNSVPAEGETIQIRKTANLHTGGTIHDVTARLHPDLATAAETAARVIDIPVTGLDFIVPDIEGPDYAIIEANERPGLANHEPQPTAERFVDLLFPQTARTGRGQESVQI
jgi:GNAT-family acetyltransferase (TIGR03103 family)